MRGSPRFSESLLAESGLQPAAPIVSTIPAALAAALADRYRLERELGQGGMATVYLAHDLKHDRQVAHQGAAARAGRR